MLTFSGLQSGPKIKIRNRLIDSQSYSGAFSCRPAKRRGTGLISCNLFHLLTERPDWRWPPVNRGEHRAKLDNPAECRLYATAFERLKRRNAELRLIAPFPLSHYR